MLGSFCDDSLAIYSPTLQVGPGTQTYHGLWPQAVYGHLTQLILKSHLGSMVCMSICEALVHSLSESHGWTGINAGPNIIAKF